MMKKIDFTFSDLIAGYVKHYDSVNCAFSLETSDGREFMVYLPVLSLQILLLQNICVI